ncbi:hypothetical protein DL95DRAFT_457439 [Leptodontidium sp. 2 PMI_412]|nr:hypothetical protein DL95DRAFT_457439 [Leptodontidium sp. 2 PMI_412]
MPDPLTALGAAAAASQFVSQGLKITIYFYQAFQKIKDAPENIRKALAEVEQLISISKLIIQNESLQTESIASTLGICLRDITKLESILRKVSPGEDASKSEKFRKAVVATFKEDAITKLLASLDREKMNLSLCMHEINSSLLGSIGIQLQVAQTTAGELLLVVNDSARNVQTVVDVLPGIAEQVTTIHDTFPDMSSKLSMISTDLLPAIISLIQQLHHICGQDRQCSTTIVLRALGGQGKSQVAMRFCQQTRGSTFVSTLWIDASSNLSIRKEFQMFNASSQNPSSNNMDSMDAIAACTRDIFERMNEPWLIVLDNLDDPGNISLIRDCIPLSKLGVVLITSRHADAVVLASPKCSIELAPLPDVTASELLLVAANCDADTSSSTTVALEISSKLSYNPLAIA